MRSSSSLFFFRRGGDGLGVSRLVPSKDAGEAVPLIALVCSGTFLFVVVVVRVLAVSLSLYLFFFFFDVMNAFFDTTRREECLLPKCSRKGRGRGGGRASARCVSPSLCLCLYFLFCGVFASFPNENQKYVLLLSVSIRSPRWGDLYVEANPSFAWILRLARGKETRHRRASPREASERPKVVQTSSEKVFRGKE